MLNRLAHRASVLSAVVCASLFVAVGLHIAVLQLAAWSWMLVSRAQTMPLTEAIGTTFDGDHPCRICCLIAGQQSTAHVLKAPDTTETLRGIVAPQPVRCRHESIRRTAEAPPTPSLRFGDPPPVPPPRFLAV